MTNQNISDDFLSASRDLRALADCVKDWRTDRHNNFRGDTITWNVLLDVQLRLETCSERMKNLGTYWRYKE